MPDDRLVAELTAGLAESAIRQGTVDEQVRHLLDIDARDALTEQDRLLFLELLRRSPDSAAVERGRLLRSLVTHCDPADAKSLEALAGAAHAGGDETVARSTLRWLVARDMMAGYSTVWLFERLERIDRYLERIPEDQRGYWSDRFFAALSRTPLDARKDLLEASRIERQTAGLAGTHAFTELEELRAFLSDEADLTKFKLTAAALARVEAAAQNWEAFNSMVEIALGLSDGRRLDDRVLDGRKVLAESVDPATARVCIQHVQGVIERALAEGAISSAAMVRSSSLLGHWCVRNGLNDAAAQLADRVASNMGRPGEHWLWVADLNRALGEDSRAAEIERCLLDEQMLPVVRMAALFRHLEAHEGRQAADALAVQAAKYTSHPEILRRAIRAATSQGDEARSATYRRRMAMWKRDDLSLAP
jgi:hypothetical protein